MSSIEKEDISVKTETKAKKHRARRQKSSVNPAASLLEALKFVAVAQKRAGSTQQQFCTISSNWVAASNGVLTIATKIQEDLAGCPHTYQLIDALSKVDEGLSITQMPLALTVVSGSMKAHIPCAGFDEIHITGPDKQCAVLDDRLKIAFESVAGLATEGAKHAYLASVLLQSGTVVATNGAVLIEAWHGFDLPPDLLIPKAAAVAVSKTTKILTGFGFSPLSATFWFEDGSFIKTQLFSEQYPHYRGILEVDNLNPWPLPDEFFKAVKAIETFSKNGIVYIKNGFLSSDKNEESSTYKIEGLPEGMAFNAKYLIAAEHAFKKVHFNKEASKAYFFGENVRGVLAGVSMKKERDFNEGAPL